MMGTTNIQASMFHYSSVAQLAPPDDPLRAIETVIDLLRDDLGGYLQEIGATYLLTVGHGARPAARMAWTGRAAARSAPGRRRRPHTEPDGAVPAFHDSA